MDSGNLSGSDTEKLKSFNDLSSLIKSGILLMGLFLKYKFVSDLNSLKEGGRSVKSLLPRNNNFNSINCERRK